MPAGIPKLLSIVLRSAAVCLSAALGVLPGSTCELRVKAEATDVIVVGAGVVGLSVARELAAKYNVTVKV